MNFLITGGAGFLGAALSNRLLRQGHHVRVLDDLSTGNPNALDPEVHFTRGDINDRPKLWTLLQDIDCVYHMAARVSVPESILFPRDYTAVNVVGTVNLMEAARDAGTPKVVLAFRCGLWDETARADRRPGAASGFALCSVKALIGMVCAHDWRPFRNSNPVPAHL